MCNMLSKTKGSRLIRAIGVLPAVEQRSESRDPPGELKPKVYFAVVTQIMLFDFSEESDRTEKIPNKVGRT